MRTTVSGYRLHHLLHRGNGHELWLGQVSEGPGAVVIKSGAVSSDLSDARPLAWEAEVLSTVGEHPNVVELIEVIDDPPGQMLVMPWAAGGSLRDLLDERGTLTPGELVAVFEGVGAAVRHLADHDLVHGDLRPDHIVLTMEGRPLLVGFGGATAVSGELAGYWVAEPQLDAAGRPAGAIDDPAYLHPTLAAGGRPGARSEVFSLGVMAYECLTGRVPHRGTPAEVVALAAAQVHRPLSSWPSVPEGVAEVVEAALTPDGSGVPVDAADFMARLRAAVDPSTVVQPRPRVVLTRTTIGPAAGETLPFGPTPPAEAAHPQDEAWRVAVASVIATVVVAALWFLAGVALSL